MTTESETSRECVICYETLQTTNVCVTPCGHEFCFNCMMKHVQRNNGCPCCRTTLIEPTEDSDDEDIDLDGAEEQEDDSGSDVSSISGDNDLYGLTEEYPIELLVAAFETKKYDLKDALSLLMYRFSKTDPKYTRTFIQTLEMDIEDMNDELQKEHDESINMMGEDANALTV